MAKFYCTTPIYYVNDRPHIGHAYSTFAADALVTWHRLSGESVFFLTGTDENAQKNSEAAAKRLGVTPAETSRAQVQAYVDEMSAVWQRTWDTLGIRYDRFIRTTEPAHLRGVEQFIAAVQERGDIYKGTYRGWYCVGCEAFVPEGDLVEGKCATHLRVPERIEEENYFFRLAKYRDALLAHIEQHPEFIQPESRRNEIVAYIRDHLADISISRPMRNWGIPFPGDPAQAVYVWFDALGNYLTGVGYGTDAAQFAQWWPADLHLIGKDIIKFHCALWPAMLLSAGIPLPRRVFAHGFFTIDGQKMSKSLGNVVDPVVSAQRYGLDALRFFLFREISFGGDGDFSEARLAERYAAELQHGIGNFAARTIAMVRKYTDGRVPAIGDRNLVGDVWARYADAFDRAQLHEALAIATELVRVGDQLIEQERPWELAKRGETDRLHRVLGELVELLRHLALLHAPFTPATTDRILTALGQEDWRSHAWTELQQWGRRTEGAVLRELPHLFPPLEGVPVRG
ncbi:methionine--tRNA ligase [Candidatus Uhrbacteria bacterium]|nr:methionine--tRNA ligase [Candidatus Uhrbacteria bacterium]